MLILNNGVPKSGSTWVQKIVNKMLAPAFPAQEWRNTWKNPSVAPERLKAYFDSGAWRDRPTLIKTHFSCEPEHDYLSDPDVRIIVSYRNIPDSVLSWFYMSVRLGSARLEDKQDWLARDGITFARRLIMHRNSWVDYPNVLFLKYEDMLEKPAQHVAQIAAFLNHPVTADEIADIIGATQVKLADNEKPREGVHVRTGGRSLGKEEIAPETYDRLLAIEAGEAVSDPPPMQPAPSSDDQASPKTTGRSRDMSKNVFGGQSLYGPDGDVVSAGRWDPKVIFDTLTPHPDYWKGKRVLDNGANTLGLPLELARAGAEVIALEPDPRNRMAEMHTLALGMAEQENLKLEVHNAELFDAHHYGIFDEVLCLGIIYHLRYPQFTIDYLSTLPTKTVVLATQTHPVQGDEVLAMFNRMDKTVWPGTAATENMVLTGWHPSRDLLKKMMQWGGFVDIESLTSEKVDFPNKPVRGLTNTAYYRARVGKPVDPFTAYREFYP